MTSCKPNLQPPSHTRAHTHTHFYTHTHTHTLSLSVSYTLTHKCNVFLVETLAQLALLIHNKLIIIRGIMCVFISGLSIQLCSVLQLFHWLLLDSRPPQNICYPVCTVPRSGSPRPPLVKRSHENIGLSYVMNLGVQLDEGLVSLTRDSVIFFVCFCWWPVPLI